MTTTVATFDPLTGNAIVVSEHAQRYLLTADAINDAAMSLITISNQQDAVGRAFDAVRDLTWEVSKEISGAEGRYRTTAEALAQYADDLTSAQERAYAAIQAAGSAQDDVGVLSTRVSTLDEAAQLPGPDQQADQQRLGTAQTLLDDAHAAASAATHEYNAAVTDKDEAGNRAASLIESVVKDSPLNDGWTDNVGGFVGGIADWIGDVLGNIIDFIAAVVDVVARLLLAVLIIAALAALILLAMATLGIGSGFLIGVVIGLAVAASVALVALALVAMARESGTPTVTPGTTGTSRSRTNDPYSTAFLEQNRIDLAGDLDGDGDPDVGVIRVTKVIGEDGVTRWRVQIPGTQEWSPLSGDIPNDFNSGLVAKLNPAQQTQLEKGVEQALLGAGYTPGDPTMLSGFSLGGITAGNLAADPDFAASFNVQSVLTGGSPLDDIYIPPNISVLSLEHRGDPVVKGGDLLAGPPLAPNRVVINVDGPSVIPSSWNSNDLAPFGHGASDYAVTARDQITRSTDPRVVDFRNESAEFFGPHSTYTNFNVSRG